jgi:hypothetical protein
MIAAHRPVVAVDDLPWIVIAEFQEQPGLRLTLPQVQRLWSLSMRECQDTLDYLIDAGMLVHGGGGFFSAPESREATRNG